MEICECVARQIKKIMEEKNMTLKDFSQKVNVSISTLRRILSNKVKTVKFIVVYKIVLSFSMSIDEFLMEYKGTRKNNHKII